MVDNDDNDGNDSERGKAGEHHAAQNELELRRLQPSVPAIDAPRQALTGSPDPESLESYGRHLTSVELLGDPLTRREHFTIDGFDFGIEPGTAIAEILDSDDGLHVEVRGSQSVMDQLVAEDAHWGWISYPPHFHIYGVDFIETDGVISSNQDLDPGPRISEASIYAVAHRTIKPFTVSVADGWVTASGMVHGMAADPFSFDIAFKADVDTQSR